MRLTFCLTLCLVQIVSYASAAKGKYTVIAPGTIHSNEKYTAAVAVYNTDTPCLIKVGITGPSYNETKEVEISQSEVKNVEFELPPLEKGDYNLTAEGVNCLENFKNSTRLIYNKFNNHVRIQTDKGLYKPGDKINFRIIFMDKDLKPAQPEKDAVIWFEDGKRNRIKEIRDFNTTKGVYTGQFKISEFPVTGGWRLGVRNGGRYDRNVYFEVDKYVLPKYVVKVEATESVSVKDGDMQVIVRANYTYGKPLDGKATVIMTLGSGYYYDTSRNSETNQEKKEPPTLIKSADMVKGKAKIDFNVKEYDAFLPYKNSPSFLSIVATAEEQFTGVKINGTASTTIYPYRYSMNCVSYENCSTFEVGKERDVLFQITYIDGSHLKDTKSNIELIYTEVLRKNSWWHRARTFNGGEEDDDSEIVTTMIPPISENRTISFNGHMNETGFVSFLVSLADLPEYEGYSHYYSMELKYLDEQREVYTTYQYREPKKVDTPNEEDDKTKEYFLLMDKYSVDNKLYLDKPDQFTLNSSQPLHYFVYNVIGRGNILKSGRVDLPKEANVYNLTLTPEISWAPSFALYVHYVDGKGEFQNAEQRYNIEFKLQNEINVTAPEQVKPGEEVALKIQTTPNSFVGLMAVDQSVLLLRNNNDLKPYEFTWTLGSYSTSTPYQGGYSDYPGSTSGCVTLTNADYFYNWTRPDYMSVPFSAADRGFISNDGIYLKTAVQAAAAPASSGGAGGFSGGQGAGSVQVRKDFSETWLFADIENTETAEFTWSKKIPETITSWVLTAFSMNPDKGLGVTSEQTKVTTFLPFFISVRLPYSVKRGEIINVPALVFNYLEKDLDVEVTLDNSDAEYEFTEFDNEVINKPKRSKTIRVPANGAAGVSFLLKPKIIGNVMLKFSAISPVAGDAIHKSMKVVPEGLTQYANRAYFVNLKNEPEFKSSFELELPEDLVPDSEHVEIGVMGDILGPVLNNLDNLVRLPSGCGEQTMSSLLPNYLVMKYLMNSKRLTPTMDTKLRYNLETGYQNMLNYRHTDGSFSSFGPPGMKERHRNGSTWLTAYVVRSLQQIKEFVKINDKIIEDALEYLSKQQAENGTFTEQGDYFYASQRNHITLTGATVLALLENSTYAEKYAQQLNKALDFMAQNIDKSDSLHAQALGTYTLNKAKRAEAKENISKLKSLVKTESDRMWWSEEKEQPGRRWWFYVYSNDVEITSYVLLTLLDQKSTKVDDIVPIVKWLIGQRNSYGGFASTQDTVVGLTALINFAQFADYEPAKMNVAIESKDKKETIKLTEDNGILYQNIEMPPTTKSVDFTAKGTGSALVQIAYQYNIFEKDPQPSFTIKTTKTGNHNRPSHLEILVCVNYEGEGPSSNMALLEISTPSGYVIDDESLKDISKLERVSNTELKNADSKLIVYFDHLYKNDETCLMVEAFRTHNVAMQKPASIVLYDYYDISKITTAFYEVESKLCDICETEEECSKCK